jgi:hypothetical protein
MCFVFEALILPYNSFGKPKVVLLSTIFNAFEDENGVMKR